MAASGSIVWLASYPKSGNTWLRAMLTALLDPEHQLNDLNAMLGGHELSERQFLDDSCGIDSSNLGYEQLKPYVRAMRQMAGELYQLPYFAKTHDRFGRTSDGLALFPAEVSRLAVLIVRHPCDVAISLAAHNRSDIDAAIGCMADPDYRLNHAAHEGSEFLLSMVGDWSIHTESWLDQDEVPLLLIRYEDMIADAQAVLRKVAEASGLTVDEPSLQAAVAAAGFDRLKAAEKATGFAEKPAGMTEFFRSGEAGGWKNTLSVEQALAIMTRHAIVIRRLGYAD